MRLQQVYGESVNQEAASALIQKFYQQALQEHDLHLWFNVQPEPLKPTEEFSFRAEFEVYPEVELGAVDKYQVVQPQSSVTETDIDSMLEKVKQQHQTLALVDRAAKDGDTLTIDYAGTIDGESFAGGSAEKTAF